MRTCNFPTSSAHQRAVSMVLTSIQSKHILKRSWRYSPIFLISSQYPYKSQRQSFLSPRQSLLLFSVYQLHPVIYSENIYPKITSNFKRAITQHQMFVQALLCCRKLHVCPQVALKLELQTSETKASLILMLNTLRSNSFFLQMSCILLVYSQRISHQITSSLSLFQTKASVSPAVAGIAQIRNIIADRTANNSRTRI